MNLYAGVGSRETPQDTMGTMSNFAEALALLGFTLRSGGAKGADLAFEKGCDLQQGAKQIFYANDAENDEEAMKLASSVHPNWNACNHYARLLHARNCYQLFGKDLDDPVDFVICWTKDGGPSGGTGTAIRLAHKYHIKVYNLYNEDDLYDLLRPFKEAMHLPAVRNCKHDRDWNKRPNAAYIGRPRGNDPHHYGNPFSHIPDKTKATVIVNTREEAVHAFDDWLYGRAWQDVEPERLAWIRANGKRDLKGKELWCWCDPELCHGLSLRLWANF